MPKNELEKHYISSNTGTGKSRVDWTTSVTYVPACSRA